MCSSARCTRLATSRPHALVHWGFVQTFTHPKHMRFETCIGLNVLSFQPTLCMLKCKALRAGPEFIVVRASHYNRYIPWRILYMLHVFIVCVPAGMIFWNRSVSITVGAVTYVV